MSYITPYQNGKPGNPAPFVPNLPVHKIMSEGEGHFAAAPKLRPIPRPATPRTPENHPPATTPNLAGGSFTPPLKAHDISLRDAIMSLYRDLPRAVDTAERRIPHLDNSEKAELSQYREFITSPYMLSLLMLVSRSGLKSFTLTQTLSDNPLFRIAQISGAMIDALQSRGHVGIAIASVYDASEDADDIQRRILAHLAHQLRDLNTVKNENSDFRSLLPS